MNDIVRLFIPAFKADPQRGRRKEGLLLWAPPVERSLMF